MHKKLNLKSFSTRVLQEAGKTKKKFLQMTTSKNPSQNDAFLSKITDLRMNSSVINFIKKRLNKIINKFISKVIPEHVLQERIRPMSFYVMGKLVKDDKDSVSFSVH